MKASSAETASEERAQMKEFENRVAIVTGTTGIGRAIAKRLASGGCSVVSCGIEAPANHELHLV
jgi:meso-butanediol dehydrogenase / (S,S)-butanediol dehydrogenase / diacetyl reductase